MSAVFLIACTMSGSLLHIDGSTGEGGGQILRTSLALSLATGRPFRIERIRAQRDKPGLRRQHLTCVEAARAIGQAEVAGAEVGSHQLSFRPGAVQPGEYFFSIGTAGSTSLVLQAVLPPLWLAAGPSTVTVEGGTHNTGAPPFDFLQRAFLPLVARMGPRTTLALRRHGFYPRGCGLVTATVEPVPAMTKLELLDRGGPVRVKLQSMISRLPRHIARRELAICQQLRPEPSDADVVEVRDSPDSGNVMLIVVESPSATEVFTAFGRLGVPAEQVASTVASEAQVWLDSDAPVGTHLADQLIVPLALAGGGAFRTLRLSLHSTTNMAVVERFLDVRFEVESEPGGTVRVTCQAVHPAAAGNPALDS
jgi:RNA 3'-terminal phosphate cyclase (ATP)